LWNPATKILSEEIGEFTEEFRAFGDECPSQQTR
jgi:hypothetical protein